jgi:hypothetical protein
VLTGSTPIVSLSTAVLSRYRVSVPYSEQVVAYPDRTALFGDYFLLGGHPSGTQNSLSRRSIRASAIEREARIPRGYMGVFGE